jgi:hypothetical protein
MAVMQPIDAEQVGFSAATFRDGCGLTPAARPLLTTLALPLPPSGSLSRHIDTLI